MPLTPKGKEIMGAMQNEYGVKKGKAVFYASANAGKIKGVHHSPDSYQDDGTGPEPARKEYHAAQEGLGNDAGPKGKDVGGTDSPRVTPKTLQGGYSQPGKGKNNAPAESYTDDVT